MNRAVTYGDGKLPLTIQDPTLSTEGDATPYAGCLLEYFTTFAEKADPLLLRWLLNSLEMADI